MLLLLFLKNTAVGSRDFSEDMQPIITFINLIEGIFLIKEYLHKEKTSCDILIPIPHSV